MNDIQFHKAVPSAAPGSFDNSNVFTSMIEVNTTDVEGSANRNR